ncbi:MAG: helix-turn-helix transcriptional regulator [Clostridiales bacterium]|nr:helix-turn-helix transcriptional regulator [Clostridiales bacterium]
MTGKLSPWCKKAKIEMIRGDITPTMLAKELGYSREHVSSVLNGRVVSPPAIKKISDYLHISDSYEE